MSLTWNLGKVTPLRFANEGQRVLVIRQGKVSRAQVTCAAGDRARVRGDGFEVWRNVRDLATPFEPRGAE